MGDDGRKIEPALHEGNHLVPGLEHLATVDALEVEHLEDHLVPVDLEAGRRNAEDGDLAAIVHLVDHVAEGRRRPRHFETDIKALGHADRLHHVGEVLLRGVDDVIDADALGERQPRRVDVGDHHLARTRALGNQCPHDADRPGAGDEHVLADEIEGKGGVHGIAERVEDRRDLVGHVVRDRHDVIFRQADELAEGTRAVDADAERVAAQMPAAGAAVAAFAADDMALARHPLADMVLGDGRADLGDLAHELMADDHRHRDGLLRPLVPVPDVHVGAADRRFLHLDQHVVRADLRHRHPLHPEAFFRLRFHQRLHHVRHQSLPQITPSSRPTASKAAIARRTSFSLWAADICVRMRACPFGTTGKEKPMT
ncbi:hypothetical protein D9M69_424840 [compost metagenome]